VTLPSARLGGAIAIAAAACLFGTLGPVSRGAYDAGLTPLTFALWRASLGTIGLLAIIGALTLRGRDRFHWTALDRRTVAAFGAAVSAGLVLNLAIFSAFRQMSIALALLGFYTYPALVAIGSVVLGEEQLTRSRVAALALALLGMVVVVLGGSGDGSDGSSGNGLGFELAGFGLALLAAAMQAVYVLLGRRGFPAVPTGEATLVVLGGNAAGFFALTVVTGSLDVALLPFRSPDVLPVLLWAGFAGASIPTLLFLLGIRAIGPTRAAIIALIEPVAGTALAAVLLAELLGPVQVAGGVLVLVAAALLQRGGEAAEPHEATSGTA
jgi:drug/metabolite transporter (DMT)-like permease